DGGTTWDRYSTGMANAQINDLEFNATTDILAAGTGRGLWEILLPRTRVLTSFRLIAPSSTAAGSSFTVTVAALDQFQQVFTSYTGTLHFTSKDGRARLPAESIPANSTA